MSKKPVAEFFADKFNECKDKVNEEMRKNAVIANAKRQIVDASRKLKYFQAYQIHELYYEAIHYLYFNLRAGEAEFYKSLKTILLKVENKIDKKIMICALANFCENHPAEISPGIMYDYATRWHHRVNNNLFYLIDNTNSKPFWGWMVRHKSDDFDLLNMLCEAELTFEAIISWIASDEEYIEKFFEEKFDFFMEQIVTCVTYVEEENALLTLGSVFDTIWRILPKYVVKVLNYLCLYCLDAETSGILSANDFIYILNYMADYEYIAEKEVFSNAGKNEWPDVDYEGCVDVVEEARGIIYLHSLNMEVAEIAWILQNRFGVEESVINDAIAESAIEEFDGGNLNELLHNEKLAPLFQFPVAYKLFWYYFEDIVKGIAKCAFAELEKEYGIECKVVKT